MPRGAIAAFFLAQVDRLWQIDVALTRRVNLIAAKNGEVELCRAEARLLSGLKLLHMILPLKESIVYQPNDDGELVPCARLRTGTTGSLDLSRNKVWRNLIQLCDRVLETDQIARIRAGEIDALENDAIPRRHNERTAEVLFI